MAVSPLRVVARALLFPVMTQVAVQLPDDLNRFVQQSIASGAYHSADEFFVSVLANLKEQAEAELSEDEAQRLSTLRADIQIGVAHLDNGESVKNLDWDAFLAERHRHFDSRRVVS